MNMADIPVRMPDPGKSGQMSDQKKESKPLFVHALVALVLLSCTTLALTCQDPSRPLVLRAPTRFADQDDFLTKLALAVSETTDRRASPSQNGTEPFDRFDTALRPTSAAARP